MNIKIKDKKYFIIPISKLDFQSFNKILLEKEAYDLKEYISVFIDMPIEELMESKISSIDMRLLHVSVFDCDIEKTIKNKPLTFSYDNDIHLVDEMRLDTFGKNYIFDLYLESYNDDRINFYELAIYSLACHISNTFDMNEIEQVFNRLITLNWRKVLPPAFFLLKQSLKKKRGFLLRSIHYTAQLKRITLLSRYQMSTFGNSIKRLLHSY